MSTDDARDVWATGLDACGDCALSSGAGCCGGADHGHGGLRSDRAVAAAAGGVTLLLSLAVLSVSAAQVGWVVVPTLVTAVGGALLLGLGAVALRRNDRVGDRAIRRALRLVPLVAGGLVVTLGLGLVAVLTSG